MSDDIVTQLREEWAKCRDCMAGNDAADEIERLEEERDQWKQLAQGFAKYASNSAGLASKLYDQMEQLLRKETGRD